jgi:hypothetical protein
MCFSLNYGPFSRGSQVFVCAAYVSNYVTGILHIINNRNPATYAETSAAHTKKLQFPEDGQQLGPIHFGALITNKNVVEQVGVKFYITCNLVEWKCTV